MRWKQTMDSPLFREPAWELTPIKLGIIALVIGFVFYLLSVMFDSCIPLRSPGSLLLFGGFGYLMGALR